jgi:hypothetical protein
MESFSVEGVSRMETRLDVVDGLVAEGGGDLVEIGGGGSGVRGIVVVVVLVGGNSVVVLW